MRTARTHTGILSRNRHRGVSAPRAVCVRRCGDAKLRDAAASSPGTASRGPPATDRHHVSRPPVRRPCHAATQSRQRKATDMLKAELKVVGGKHHGRIIPLTTRKFLVGREPDCHLRPNSESVSRHHCVFTLDDYTCHVRDLGSTNGTYVNGRRITGQVRLKSHDRVTIGKLTFEVIVHDNVRIDELDAKEAAARATVLTDVSGPAVESTTTIVQQPDTAAEETSVLEGDTAFETPKPAPAAQPPEQPQETAQPPAPAETPQPAAAETAPAAPPQPGQPTAPPATQPYPQQPGYPQQPPYPQQPGYPPMPGYPQPGYYPTPGAPYPPQGYPGYYQQPGTAQPYYPAYGQPPAGQPPAAQPTPPAAPNPPSGANPAPPQLPDPSETGAKPAAPGSGQGTGSSNDTPNPAADAIKRYMNRR
ncbi:MAG: FHA domain-containing protein [Planctomycetota bacterium]|nr:MAG: FHA domain-containing protein [Planctomycetota bacterium]